MKNQFALDVESIRKHAREKMDEGAVTAAYEGSLEQVISVLNDVLATELVCWARYEQHAITASGIHSGQVSAELHEHAEQERQHAVAAAERIDQLGGEPDFSPSTLEKRSHTEYRTFDADDLRGMLEENLVAERIVIQSYQQIARWLGDGDPTTRRLIEWILEQEEEHAGDLSDLLAGITG